MIVAYFLFLDSDEHVDNKIFFKIKFFFSTRRFLDIEKSVRLKLKGVKIIRTYRDLFQLIRYLFQLIYSSFSD